ncbi:MAG: hypothetical protein OHK0017_06250 [Patescibacteria group bacterium]
MVFRYLVPVAILLTVFLVSGSSKPVEYYLLATMVFYIFTLPMNISYEMKDGVLFGKYARQLLLPIDMHFFYLLQSVGIMLVPFLIRLVVFCGLFVVFKVPILFTWNSLAALLFALIFGLLISFAFEILIGNTSFWLPDNKFLLQGYQDLVVFLTGSVIPLVGILSWLSYTPFAFAVYHPMMIYQNKYSLQQIIQLVGSGLLWFIFILAISRHLFRYGLKRNESVGL